MTLSVMGPVHAKAVTLNGVAPNFDRSTHSGSDTEKFNAAACANLWSEEERELIFALKGPTEELL